MASHGTLLLYNTLVAAVVVFFSLAARLSVAAASSPAASLSFSLTYTDPQSSSSLRVLDGADPADDLPVAIPMRSFVAAGLSYKIAEPAIYVTIPVGNPPQNLIFLADTGSEFSWTQCSPCPLCNDTGAPRFISQHSSSYLTVPCNSSLLCTKGLGFETNAAACSNSSLNNVTSCIFAVGYGDKTTAAGAMAVDSFRLHPNHSLPFIFGCAVVDVETVSTSSSGLIGLSAGPFSFVSQLFNRGNGAAAGRGQGSCDGAEELVPNTMAHKFVYCLTDRSTPNASSVPGTILFGDYNLAVNLSYTKLVPPYGALGALYYFVGFEGITVGSCKFIEVAMETGGVRPGGTIVDSGTGFTQLVKGVYRKFVKALLEQTADDLHPLWVTDSGIGSPASVEAEIDDSSSLCYTASVDAEQPPQVPLVTLHLAGMVDLELGPTSVLFPSRLDNGSVYFCLAFSASSDDSMNIIGNYQQQKYWVEYNLQTSSLGIAKATSCAHDVVLS